MPAAPAPPYASPVSEMTPDPETGRSRPTGMFARAWIQWFLEILGFVNIMPRVIGVMRLVDQSAAFGATDLAVGTAGSQSYRISIYARISVPATVNSTLTVTLRWTDGTVAQHLASGNINGNTTDTLYVTTVLIHTDASSPITIETTYASAGATPMTYEIRAFAEEVPTL